MKLYSCEKTMEALTRFLYPAHNMTEEQIYPVLFFCLACINLPRL